MEGTFKVPSTFFEYMPGLVWKYGFAVVLALTAGSCAVLFLCFRRAGWL